MKSFKQFLCDSINDIGYYDLFISDEFYDSPVVGVIKLKDLINSDQQLKSLNVNFEFIKFFGSSRENSVHIKSNDIAQIQAAVKLLISRVILTHATDYNKETYTVENLSINDLHKLPRVINASFVCYSDSLDTLHNFHKHVTTIDHMAEFHCPFKSNLLPLLMIKSLDHVVLNNVDRKVEQIINNYLPNTRGNDAVYECQNELIDAGFEEYAQL